MFVSYVIIVISLSSPFPALGLVFYQVYELIWRSEAVKQTPEIPQSKAAGAQTPR